ncbi:hypothetical protein GCM10009117_16230 [Gangjinia marincola]|uniref:Bacterial surface antigen (D15) domain-containing protein n=1 Tax=Gangjinia marincola TaxID=578463 RepID=A0ABP3XSU8_9FLAO
MPQTLFFLPASFQARLLKNWFEIKWILLLLLFFIIGSQHARAQEIEELKEIFTFHPNKKAAAKDSTLYKSKLITAPVISYSPETNVGFGVGAKYLFKFKGSGEETRTSNMPATIQYTLNNQFILYSGFEVFTNQEKWVITGNLLFQNYPRLYFGIGNDSPKENEEEYDYYQLTVEPIVLKRAFLKYLFLGGGVRYNRIYNVTTEEDGLLETNQPEGYLGSTSVGAEFAALYDDRENILNASKGWYIEFTHGFYGKVLGGTNEFELTRFDVRHYLTPFSKRKDVLAFQVLGYFSNRDVPFGELALLGSGEIMRGYREGRFVDRGLMAAQVEYRLNIKNSRWGFVGFAGAGEVFRHPSDFNIGDVKPNAGIGIRFLLDQKEKLNLRVDYGFGENTNNLYLNIAEAF